MTERISRAAARAPLWRGYSPDGLAAGLADPAQGNLPHQIGAADDPDQPPAVQDRHPPDTPVRQQMRHILRVGLRTDADHAPAHDVGDGCTVFGKEVVLGYEAHQRAGVIDYRQAADPVAREQPCRVLDPGVIVHGDDVGRHYLINVHCAFAAPCLQHASRAVPPPFSISVPGRCLNTKPLAEYSWHSEGTSLEQFTAAPPRYWTGPFHPPSSPTRTQESPRRWTREGTIPAATPGNGTGFRFLVTRRTGS